jgi:type II secretory pathway pseudopilin PulG
VSGRHDGAAGDRGETLVELVISIAIMGIAVVAVLGAVRLAVDGSSFDQRRVQAKSALRAWGESIAQRVSDANYPTCGSDPDPAHPLYAPSAIAVPAGFTGTVAEVSYWNGTAFAAPGGCAAGIGDRGAQRVRLHMHVSDSVYSGFDADLWITVRKPCATTNPC